MTLLTCELPLPPSDLPAGELCRSWSGEAWQEDLTAPAAWAYDCLGAMAMAGCERTRGPVQVIVYLPRHLAMMRLKPVTEALVELLTAERLVEDRLAIVDICVRWSEGAAVRVELTRFELEGQ